MSRVAVLEGGRSLERGVSLRSGARVRAALARRGHEVVGVDVGEDLVTRLRDVEPDVCFVALHGPLGEDGTVQGLLDVLGLRYTGSGAAVCRQAFDKVRAKDRMREAGIPTPDSFALTEAALRDLGAAEALAAMEERLDFPVVVKPSAQGSALGVRFAATAADVPGALVAAFSYADTVLLERHVAGRDLAVSVLGGEALPAVEAVPRDAHGYDFEARYEIGRTDFVCPADLDEATAGRAADLALAAWQTLGLGGVARIDLMLDAATGALHVLEANPVPGMTETSLLPQAAEAAGVGFDDLVERILSLA